jgi:hypothetical protein
MLQVQVLYVKYVKGTGHGRRNAAFVIIDVLQLQVSSRQEPRRLRSFASGQRSGHCSSRCCATATTHSLLRSNSRETTIPRCTDILIGIDLYTAVVGRAPDALSTMERTDYPNMLVRPNALPAARES